MIADIRRFDDFELDSNSNRLSRGGHTVHLERIPLKLLCLLIERRGEIVTREEILREIWGKGVFIDSESAINTAVRKIRRALGDDPDTPRFIVTLPTKGYRFIAQVEVSNGELKDIPNVERASNGEAPNILDAAEPVLPSSANTPVETERSNFWLTFWPSHSRLVPLAGVIIIVVAGIALPHLRQKATDRSAPVSSPESSCRLKSTMPSIAVLPFTNLSGDPQQEYFSDGISNQLIEDLAHLPGLFVIARNSSFAYKGRLIKEPEIARELGAKYLLEGDVRKVGDRVRVGVGLVDASSAREMWTQRFDRPLRDILALQDEIAGKVVTTLGLLLRLDQRVEPIFRNFRMTDNIEALDDYLRAREYNFRLTKQDNATGRYWAKKATELDPHFAEAYAILAWTYFNDAWNQWVPNYLSDLSRARELAEKALALDDTASDALALITELDWLQGRFGQAVADGQRAVSINPNYAFGYQSLADALSNDAKPNEAYHAVEKAICLDPAGYNFYAYQLGTSYVQSGRYAEAIPILKRHLSGSPNSLVALVALVVAYTELGRDREARDGAAEIMRISPHYTLPPTNSAWYNQPGEIGAWHRRVVDDLHKAGIPFTAAAIVNHGTSMALEHLAAAKYLSAGGMRSMSRAVGRMSHQISRLVRSNSQKATLEKRMAAGAQAAAQVATSKQTAPLAPRNAFGVQRTQALPQSNGAKPTSLI